MIKYWTLILCTVFLFSIEAQGALTGEERILNYQSNIVIHNNSVITVDEIITVEAQNRKLKRGIYRDFPTKYKDRYGNNVTVKLQLLGVKKNNKPEPYHTEKLSNGLRIYVGDSNTILKPGIYTYHLTYTIKHALGYFEQFDELYWNITGNDWAFPIEKAKTVIKIPKGAPFVQYSAYTGRMGEKGKAYQFQYENDVISFETTRPLNPKEGLTIAVAWAKGFVSQPTASEKWERWVSDNRSLIFSFIMLFVILGYYILVWVLVGRDLPKGTIIPLFGPPKGFTPAICHYILNMGFRGNTAFTAAMINLAVKGFIRIESTKKKYSAEKIKVADETIQYGEKVILEKLFSKNNSIKFQNENHVEIKAAIDAFKKKIQAEFTRLYFRSNAWCFIVSLILTLFYLIGVVVFSEDKELTGFMMAWLSIWTFAVINQAQAVYVAWRDTKTGIFKALITTLFAVPFFMGEVVGLFFLAEAISLMGAVILLLVMSINFLFYHLLKQPTLHGRKIMDQIEGFKLFLTVAEQHRFEMLHPPEITPEVFEKFLPYAIALGVENAWCQKFDAAIAKAKLSGVQLAYHPSWYSGITSYRTFGAVGFATAVGSSLSNSISSSSTAPGSSSGSGGGGSSGGGGGGGGGGGW